MQTPYPDISGIISAKARRRRVLAALPWEKKVAIVERMRRLRPKDMWKDEPVSPQAVATASATNDA
jgi:hypothetical protein